ncbi:hypothetical protein [Aestuariivirga sp.]|uniref:hypothetical protein n=1 Tax=Aestuariivirga sp. TaxID=2650926 RepID=UPI0025BAEF8E|nr:hypothetical protein [Aestuariivirga sp.]MCA3554548.1 hypothetical protein [Aestuariivirga sp.]
MAKNLPMRRLSLISLVLLIAGLPALGATPETRVIDFPCFKSVADGRVLVDGDPWDRKMKDLGYRLKDGEYVPWKVLSFTQTKPEDEGWADGMCRMRLLPVAQ